VINSEANANRIKSEKNRNPAERSSKIRLFPAAEEAAEEIW
jgi:hypothetical protein